MKFISGIESKTLKTNKITNAPDFDGSGAIINGIKFDTETGKVLVSKNLNDANPSWEEIVTYDVLRTKTQQFNYNYNYNYNYYHTYRYEYDYSYEYQYDYNYITRDQIVINATKKYVDVFNAESVQIVNGTTNVNAQVPCKQISYNVNAYTYSYTYYSAAIKTFSYNGSTTKTFKAYKKSTSPVNEYTIVNPNNVSVIKEYVSASIDKSSLPKITTVSEIDTEIEVQVSNAYNVTTEMKKHASYTKGYKFSYNQVISGQPKTLSFTEVTGGSKKTQKYSYPIAKAYTIKNTRYKVVDELKYLYSYAINKYTYPYSYTYKYWQYSAKYIQLTYKKSEQEFKYTKPYVYTGYIGYSLKYYTKPIYSYSFNKYTYSYPIWKRNEIEKDVVKKIPTVSPIEVIDKRNEYTYPVTYNIPSYYKIVNASKFDYSIKYKTKQITYVISDYRYTYEYITVDQSDLVSVNIPFDFNKVDPTTTVSATVNEKTYTKKLSTEFFVINTKKPCTIKDIASLHSLKISKNSSGEYVIDEASFNYQFKEDSEKFREFYFYVITYGYGTNSTADPGTEFIGTEFIGTEVNSEFTGTEVNTEFVGTEIVDNSEFTGTTGTEFIDSNSSEYYKSGDKQKNLIVRNGFIFDDIDEELALFEDYILENEQLLVGAATQTEKTTDETYRFWLVEPISPKLAEIAHGNTIELIQSEINRPEECTTTDGYLRCKSIFEAYQTCVDGTIVEGLFDINQPFLPNCAGDFETVETTKPTTINIPVSSLTSLDQITNNVDLVEYVTTKTVETTNHELSTDTVSGILFIDGNDDTQINLGDFEITEDDIPTYKTVEVTTKTITPTINYVDDTVKETVVEYTAEDRNIDVYEDFSCVKIEPCVYCTEIEYGTTYTEWRVHEEPCVFKYDTYTFETACVDAKVMSDWTESTENVNVVTQELEQVVETYNSQKVETCTYDTTVYEPVDTDVEFEYTEYELRDKCVTYYEEPTLEVVEICIDNVYCFTTEIEEPIITKLTPVDNVKTTVKAYDINEVSMPDADIENIKINVVTRDAVGYAADSTQKLEVQEFTEYSEDFKYSIYTEIEIEQCVAVNVADIEVSINEVDSYTGYSYSIPTFIEKTIFEKTGETEIIDSVNVYVQGTQVYPQETEE